MLLALSPSNTKKEQRPTCHLCYSSDKNNNSNKMPTPPTTNRRDQLDKARSSSALSSSKQRQQDSSRSLKAGRPGFFRGLSNPTLLIASGSGAVGITVCGNGSSQRKLLGGSQRKLGGRQGSQQSLGGSSHHQKNLGDSMSSLGSSNRSLLAGVQVGSKVSVTKS
ncbi:expressed unknown protein [Seminavis robusta]|uniref:Uncharacterized protein n=1 Tax=Seminavis robusta TaxID=568900 RepID=A0A9N8HGQ4_9STRA|nr:expressed unknown protein [Seminavis robusta]|eukprot:Sro408_g136910.1 n/a (165) ;mRNA; f:25054-25548